MVVVSMYHNMNQMLNNLHGRRSEYSGYKLP